jgi:hypothetical protein
MSAIRPPRPAPVLAAVALAALVSGCSAAAPGEDPPASGRSPAAGAGSPSPSASSTPLPEAADGTDLDACADAECEVVVEEGDEFAMDGAYGVERFVVTTVDGTGLSVNGFGPGTELSGHLPPPEEGSEPPAFIMNGIEITLVALVGSSAVMDMTALATPYAPTG